MLRNQHKRFDDGTSGRWAEVNGAADCWLLTWSAAPGPLEYTKPAAARKAAEDWTQRGIDPRCALTLPAVPAGVSR